MVDDLKNIIEAILLVSDNPVSPARMQGIFDEEARPETEQIHEAIAALEKDCEHRGVELKKIGSGYRFQTREKYADYMRKLHAAKPPKMSRALLETMAIIAYRQPVSRGDIEEIRGVSVSAEIMQRLIEREWVKQVGVRDVPGRPALFGTTNAFLSYFNLTSLKDLPSLMDERGLGEISGELDVPLPQEVLDALEGKQEHQQDIEDIEDENTDESVAPDSEEETEETTTETDSDDDDGATHDVEAVTPESAEQDEEVPGSAVENTDQSDGSDFSADSPNDLPSENVSDQKETSVS